AALANTRAGIAALERSDLFGRLPYVLVFLLAIHEERGEDDAALTTAARAHEIAGRARLAGWVGARIAIKSACVRALRGAVAGAEGDLATVRADWTSWGGWDIAIAHAAIADHHGDARQVRTEAARALRVVESWPYYDRTRCAAVLAPVLTHAGHADFARVAVE